MANPTPAPTPSNSTPATPQATPAAKPGEASKAVPAVTATPVAKAPVVEDSFDVTIDGKTEKKTRKEIIEAYQLRQLSDKKRSEADKVLADYKRVQELAAKDPIKFMTVLGYDIDKISTSYLAKKAEDSMKDPKERELEAAKKEAAEYKKWVEEQKAAQDAHSKRAQIEQERTKIHSEIIEAIEEKKELGLPIDEHLIIQIAQDMMVQDKAKKPLNAKEALPATYARTQKWLQGLASKMEGEALVKWLGDDVAKKIRKHDLTQLKAKRATPAQPQSNVKPKTDDVKVAPKYKTWSQFKSETLDNIK